MSGNQITPNKLVSVVVPTFNCKEMISDCLASISAQTYNPIELLIIDSHSTDGTREVAEAFGTVYSFGHDPTHKTIDAVPFKRNYGASKVTGEYLYWFDSDMRMKPDTIQRCVATIERSGADAIIVPEESYGEGFWANCRRLEKDCYNRSPRSLTDAARFMRKSVWNTLGGVDVTLGGNYDYDLQLRLNEAGFTTVKLDDSIFHYEGKLSLKRHLRKKFIYGTSAMRYFKKYRHQKSMLTKQFVLVRPDFLAHADVLAQKPFVAIGMLGMKTMEYAAAFCGLVYSRVHKLDIPPA